MTWKHDTTETTSNDDNKVAPNDSKLATIREESFGQLSFDAFSNLTPPGSTFDLTTTSESFEAGQAGTINHDSGRPTQVTMTEIAPTHHTSNDIIGEGLAKWGLLFALAVPPIFLGIFFGWTRTVIIMSIASGLLIAFFAVRWTLLKEVPVFRGAMEPVDGITARATADESNED